MEEVQVFEVSCWGITVTGLSQVSKAKIKETPESGQGGCKARLGVPEQMSLEPRPKHFLFLRADVCHIFLQRHYLLRKISTDYINSVRTRCIVKASGFTRGVCKNRGFY